MNIAIGYFGSIFIFNLFTNDWNHLVDLKLWAGRIGNIRKHIDTALVHRFQQQNNDPFINR